MNSNLWSAFSIWKLKNGDPTKIKWKKVPSKFSKIPIINVWFAFQIVSFSCRVITGRYLGFHQKLTLQSFNFNLVPSASFCYKFRVVLETRLLYARSFNNFESSIILQFFKCYETTKLSPSIYNPYHPVKPYFSQKFCIAMYTSS